MRALLCAFLFVSLEARDYDKKLPRVEDDEEPSPVQRDIDIYPQKFNEPVPFGHLTLAGFGDPYAQGKPPVNLLELDMILPRNSEEGREYLRRKNVNIQFLKSDIPKGFVNPRDKYLQAMSIDSPSQKNITELKWYSLADMHRRNLMTPSMARGRPKKKENNDQSSGFVPQDNSPKSQYFSRKMFQLKDHEESKKYNFTTCDEFAVGAIFSPKDIINIDWVPFFIWSIENHPVSIVHKFTIPTQKMVKEFRIKYGKLLPKPVDWHQMKLYMRGMSNMLLIAADRRGLFDAIPEHELPANAVGKLKIEDPYLVMMYCEEYFATVMGISGSEPTNYKEMKAEAGSIKFKGPGKPVWRDYEGETEKRRRIQNKKMAEEQAKFLAPLEEIPPIARLK
ncbi:unnamed protein product [Chrysodeixis includens]|uniref:Uncharacterized protein n=1 Tax=Chrysodeixis includens TaxID=689277 RepID=A0A9N8L3S4_CHRIL|nr:unnamed protein product [Chrysodeixis includens]